MPIKEITPLSKALVKSRLKAWELLRMSWLMGDIYPDEGGFAIWEVPGTIMNWMHWDVDLVNGDIQRKKQFMVLKELVHSFIGAMLMRHAQHIINEFLAEEE